MHAWRDREGPILKCAHCGERITDATMAGVVWKRDPTGAPDTPTVMVLCKTRHCISLPQYRGWPWNEVDDFLVHLARNVGLGSAKAWRTACASVREMEQAGL